ncbi:hypothetical protein [Enterococcus sp. BWR-S5]|uniref:hypothetical protein n=1 Tax=Enterococcus sp. BWR-S5 TaxID=2787714 RepID=UPI0019234782|nr:hypothetical protein [Enterococcus sp. BWR-S5]MBL1226581.1 hypothetical protein [Enterococcus sp. BWR-S5]
MEGKRITSEKDKFEFVENVLSFAIDKSWTISNLTDAFGEAIEYMENNATLNELADPEMPARTKD